MAEDELAKILAAEGDAGAKLDAIEALAPRSERPREAWDRRARRRLFIASHLDSSRGAVRHVATCPPPPGVWDRFLSSLPR